jgi:hypothetical protein
MKNRFQAASGTRWMPDWVAKVMDAGPDETVEGVMTYLRDAAGFDIRIKSNVPIRESWHRKVGRVQSQDEALLVLKEATRAMGCTVVQRGRLLTILTTQDAMKECVPLPTWH